MMKRSILGLASAASVLVLAACGSSSTTATDNSSPGSSTAPSLDLISAGTLSVCSDVPYPPFEDFDKSSPIGFKGFDVDVISAIAQKLNLKVSIQDSDFAALKSGLALNSQQCDLVASAMTITPERQQAMNFSDPYYNSEQSLLVPSSSTITGIDGLAGKRVAVQTGTTGETYANAHATGADIVPFPSDGEEFQALQAGQVDAILQDLPVNLDHTKAGGFKIVEKYDTNEQYGFAMAKGNDGLTQAVDSALADLKKSGDYQKIYDSYFKIG